MEEAEGGRESEHTPVRLFEVGCLDSADQRGGEDESEPEGLRADVRERAFTLGEKLDIVRVRLAGEGTLGVGVVVFMCSAVVFLGRIP